MNFNNFSKKFIEVACDKPIHLELGLTPKEAIEIAWQTFHILLVEKKLEITPKTFKIGDFDEFFETD